MNFVFLTNLMNMTYGHYLQIPKPMIEWVLLRKTATNPKLIKAFNINTYRPLYRKSSHIINDGEINDFI